MEVLFIILPLAIVMAAVAVAAFYWSVHGGQLDDLDTPRYRMLFDESPALPDAMKILSEPSGKNAGK